MRSRVPWISRDITKAMCARNLSFRRVKKTGRLDHWNDYNEKRNNLGGKHAKEYKIEILQKAQIQCTKFLESLTNQTSSILILKDCNEKANHNDAGKATLLNYFFSSCFKNAYLPRNMSWLQRRASVRRRWDSGSALVNRHNQVEWTRRHIDYAEIYSYQHCSCIHKAHEFQWDFQPKIYSVSALVDVIYEGQKPSTKVMKYVLFSWIYGRCLTCSSQITWWQA